MKNSNNLLTYTGRVSNTTNPSYAEQTRKLSLATSRLLRFGGYFSGKAPRRRNLFGLGRTFRGSPVPGFFGGLAICDGLPLGTWNDDSRNMWEQQLD